MIRKVHFVYLLIFISILNSHLSADSFTASVNSNTVNEGDQFQVTFTFSGTDVNGVKGFTPPSFSNFLILSGPNQSTSMQIINGSVSGSISYSYYLQPKMIGKFTISSASISYKGVNYKSEPVKIEVKKGTAKNDQRNRGNSSASVNEEIGNNLFIRAVADKQRVYQGEQITITYKIYTRLNIASQMSITKLPQYQGFWAEEIETSTNILFGTEMFEGKQYRVGILKKAALFPTQSGELSVTPFELKVPVQIQRKRKTGNSVFDDFFNDPFFGGGETVEFTAKSNVIKINVLPIPENKPENFNGAVGQYSISTSLDKESTKTDEPISLKLNISGTGNIKLLNVPEIKLPAGLESYEPKTEEEVNRSSKISGTKKIEYLIVPRAPGKREIPPIKFSYFDPGKREFVTLSSPAYTINIEQGTNVSTGEYSKEEIKILGSDIRFIKTDTELDQQGSLLINNVGFWTAAILPLIALFGLIAHKKRDEKYAEDAALFKYQKAKKIAAKRLKSARIKMEQNKKEEFYTEISSALFGYLEDKLNISKSEFTIDKAAEELKTKSLDDSLINELISCTEKCEFVRFAPSDNQQLDMKEMYNKSEHLLIEIEKHLTSKKHV